MLYPKYSELFSGTPYDLDFNLKVWKKEYVQIMKKFINCEFIENPTIELKMMDFVHELYLSCYLEKQTEQFYENWCKYICSANNVI